VCYRKERGRGRDLELEVGRKMVDI